MDYISQFTSDIRYIKGESNIVADALSRIELNELSQKIDCNEFFTHQACDEQLEQIIFKSKSSNKTSKYTMEIKNVDGYNLQFETSTGNNRIYVPGTLRKSIFDSVHNLSHPGVRASRKLITTRFFWPAMNADIGRWARTCIACQRAKVSRHTKSPLGKFAIPAGRFDHIHMDIVGPLPPS